LQQVCPGPPHTAQPPSPQAFPQLEFSQSPPFVNGQAEPAGVQMSATQHPPALHSFAAQQGSPAPPHVAQ
jgi:hypothetical protein